MNSNFARRFPAVRNWRIAKILSEILGPSLQWYATWGDILADLDEVLGVVETRRIVVSIDHDDVDSELSGPGRSTAVYRHHRQLVAGCLLTVQTLGQSQMKVFRTTTHLGHLPTQTCVKYSLDMRLDISANRVIHVAICHWSQQAKKMAETKWLDSD